jgi:Fur family ferric uptake transcriptional regulator
MIKKHIFTIIREKGYKLTPQRKAVIKVITGSRNYFTPESIYDRVKKSCHGIGLTTVYRTISILLNLRLVCEVYATSNRRSYVVRKPVQPHHHLICSGCKKVVDFNDCDLTDIEQKLSKGTGFRLEGHLLEFTGICPECQRKTRF